MSKRKRVVAVAVTPEIWTSLYLMAINDARRLADEGETRMAGYVTSVLLPILGAASGNAGARALEEELRKDTGYYVLPPARHEMERAVRELQPN